MLIGFVGKPSVGKSTLFKALTLADVDIANYPFTTIKPNSGVGHVRIDCVDSEFDVKCSPRFGYCIDGKRFVPVSLLDVAGLVPGAHEGKGMGNQFLDDLNHADILIHIIDVSGSTNEKGEPVPPLSIDPAVDIRFLEFELDMWYLRLIQKGWDKFARQVNQERPELNKAVAKQLSSLRVTDKLMEQIIQKLRLDADIMKWDTSILKKIATELRKATKPMLIACNKIDVKGAYENYERLKIEFQEYTILPCSADTELALREATKHELINYIPGDREFTMLNPEKLTENQQKALQYMKESVLERFNSTGVQEVLDKCVFNLLGYIAVFPAGVGKLKDQFGNILPDCFLMPSGTTALDFAYRLHTDIGKNFVKAIDVRTKKPVGKEYVLRHRDMIEIAVSK